MTDDPLSTAYLAVCRREGEPPNTIKARARVLRSIGNAGTATREDVEAWWDTRANLSASTRTVDLAILRAFYKWCAVWEHRSDDPTVRLRAPHVANRVPRPADRGQVKRLVRELEPSLARATVLGAYLGLRVSESAAADWSDVDTRRGVMRVTGKGGKTRLVPISPAAVDLLGGALEHGNIVTREGQALSASVLAKRLNRAMRAKGVQATSHQLRHLFGTTAYEVSGGDLLAVRDLMGHVSTQTTASYAQPSMDVARRIADAMLED